MKKRFVLIIMVYGVSLFADDIDTILSKITNKRLSTMPQESILNTTSPMPKLIIESDSARNSGDANKTVLKAKQESYKLTAIMNGSANINGKWIKLGEKIGSYRLIDIMDDSIYLKSDKKEKILFFDKNSSKINISIGG